jgi:cyclohexanone monooxygenase
VEAVTENGVAAGGREYEVDCIIFASGFEVGGDMARKNGFEITGQGGVTLTEYWEAGMRSKHGTHVHGFPNLFMQTVAQNAAYIVNVPHNYMEQGKTVGAMVAHAERVGCDRVEVSKEEEDAWVELILSAQPRRMMGECTPGYYNNEGRAVDQERMKSFQGYPMGPLAYFKYIEQWRSSGDFEGLSFATLPQ